jgi:hypothetical protein
VKAVTDTPDPRRDPSPSTLTQREAPTHRRGGPAFSARRGLPGHCARTCSSSTQRQPPPHDRRDSSSLIGRGQVARWRRTWRSPWRRPGSQGVPRRGGPAAPEGAGVPRAWRAGWASPTRSSTAPTSCDVDPAVRRHQPVGARRRAGARPTRPSCWGRPRCAVVLSEPFGSRFDYVVVDAPPGACRSRMPSSSPSLVDGAIVVAGSGLVERDQLALTLESLESVATVTCWASCSTGCPSSTASSTADTPTPCPEEESTRSERKRVEPA